MTKEVLLIVYFVIWFISLAVYYFATGPSDVMGYAIVFIWGLLPVTTFVISLLIGRKDYWGRGKWLMSIFLGVMYMLLSYVTFDVSNMVSAGNKLLPDFWMLVYGASISLVGLAIGSGLYYYLGNRKRR